MEKRKSTLALPFLILPIFAVLYGILDGALMVKVFGCGCVPETQTNLLNLPFNANDLRRAVYLLLTAGMTLLAARLARRLGSRIGRAVYTAAVLAVWLAGTAIFAFIFQWR